MVKTKTCSFRHIWACHWCRFVVWARSFLVIWIWGKQHFADCKYYNIPTQMPSDSSRVAACSPVYP